MCDHAGLALGDRDSSAPLEEGTDGVPQRKPSPRGWVLEPLRLLPHVASAWDPDPDPGLDAGRWQLPSQRLTGESLLDPPRVLTEPPASPQPWAAAPSPKAGA